VDISIDKTPPTALFETICIRDGVALHLPYHNRRLNRSRKALFGIQSTIDISEYLLDIPPKGLYRAKLIYGLEIEKPSYYIYKAKNIRKITLIEADISYEHKYLDRTAIERLLQEAGTGDEILITRNGLLRDTSIANIALSQGGVWYTPASPLLPGTTRARLLQEGRLIPRDIHTDDLAAYDRLALMNAMVGFAIQPPIAEITGCTLHIRSELHQG